MDKTNFKHLFFRKLWLSEYENNSRIMDSFDNVSEYNTKEIKKNAEYEASCELLKFLNDKMVENS